MNFFKFKIEEKILRNIKQKLKSLIIKKILFKTILLRLRHFVEDNSKFKNFFFEHASFESGVFIEKFLLLFFENIFIFLGFNENKRLFFFNLSSYSGEKSDKNIEFNEKNSQFINDFFSRKTIILKKKQIIVKSIYNLNIYYEKKKRRSCLIKIYLVRQQFQKYTKEII